MLKLEVISSSSKGNAYLLSDGRSQILIECGVHFKTIQKAVNFDTSKIAGCLLTHEHKDHSMAIKSIIKGGLNIYTSKGTAEAIGIESHRIKTVEALKKFTIGDWTIVPFDVQHDVSEPLGFLVANKKGETLLFATDTYYIKYKFTDIDIIAVECNHSEKIINENASNGTINKALMYRIRKSHFSLENYIKFLKANDFSRVREIWLLHLSDTNSNAKEFKEEVQKATGKPVYIA